IWTVPVVFFFFVIKLLADIIQMQGVSGRRALRTSYGERSLEGARLITEAVSSTMPAKNSPLMKRAVI
ncbi:TPA: hypothetical protein ACIV3L_004587, partial [Salmonella enterica subsp. enterica serovar Enteritidis]